MKRHLIAAPAVTLLLIAGLAGCSSTATKADATKPATSSSSTPKADATTTADSSSSTPKAAAPAMTAGQKNALGAGKDYLAMTAFSRKGLIRQLSSSAADGYSVADATYAADHVGADWNAEAAKAAKDYLAMTSFSRAGLIQQLNSSAGDGYTLAQAKYGVSKAGL